MSCVSAVARVFCLALTAMLPVFAGSNAAASTDDPIIVNPVRYTIKLGRYSRFEAFKQKLHTALQDCGIRDAALAPGTPSSGEFGPAVRLGIQMAMSCPVMAGVPADSPARQGALTASVWRAVMGAEDIPSVDERARGMILSFEATDFGDAPEWNLCQDGTRTRFGPSHRKRGGFQCFNHSDPCSYLTWGPRGATAGSGREIQFVLWKILEREPELVRRAFGSEFDAMQRFLRLDGGTPQTCEGDVPLKRFICAIWIDSGRRQKWDEALTTLGRERIVRDAYDYLYTLREFDGAKLENFYRLWDRIGLSPSEIDYAFFLDRITHLGGPPSDVDTFSTKLRSCVRDDRGHLTANAAARRCISRLQPHKTQAVLRLGRDVAYFLDGYKTGALTKPEIDAWGGYMPLSATFNFGLSDAVKQPIPSFDTLEVIGKDRPRPTSADLTPAELTACPTEVLFPLRQKTVR